MLTSEATKYVEQYNTDNIKVSTDIFENTKNEFFKIGRPCSLPSSIDKNLRVSKFLRSKMTVIDMIPCNHQISIDKIAEKDLSGLIPTIQYDAAIKEYKDACNAYGLASDFAGIRIYTTDDTQSSDTITHNRQGENLFQGLANKINNTFSPLYNVSQTLGVSGDKNLEGAIGSAIESGAGALGSMAGMVGASDNLKGTIESVVGGLGKKITDAALNGYRYTFPTFWSDCSYDPNLSSSIKLISPYGHPDAIRKFIIEPLMYLIILASPKTKDGMSYGRPSSLTVTAYGMSYIPLGCIKSITFRRGGNSTSFNIYKQPLTIDVTLQFQPIVSGFAAFTTEQNKGETTSNADSETANKSNEFMTDYGKADKMISPMLTTLEHIVESLRPVPPDSSIEAHVSFGKGMEHDSRVGYQDGGSSIVSKFSSANILSSDYSVDILDNTIIDNVAKEYKTVDTYVDTFVNNVKVAKTNISNGKVAFEGAVDYYKTVYDDLADRIDNFNAQDALDTVGYVLDVGEQQLASTNSPSYINRRSLLSGTMNSGINPNVLGSDNISYIGNLMDIPDSYDSTDMTKFYNATGFNNLELIKNMNIELPTNKNINDIINTFSSLPDTFNSFLNNTEIEKIVDFIPQDNVTNNIKELYYKYKDVDLKNLKPAVVSNSIGEILSKFSDIDNQSYYNMPIPSLPNKDILIDIPLLNDTNNKLSATVKINPNVDLNKHSISDTSAILLDMIGGVELDFV
jgi:hypothetical protein